MGIFRKTTQWRNLGRGVIGLTIGAVFLGLSFRQTSWTQVQTILSQAQGGWLIAAISFYAVEMVFRTLRWQGLLLKVKKLTVADVGISLLVGYAMNCILPARLGELFRGDFLGRRYQISRSSAIASIIVERVLDGLAVVVILLFGRLFITEHALLNQLILFSGLLFGGLLVGLWMASRDIEHSWMRRFSPAITRRFQAFRQGLAVLQGSGFSSAVWLSSLVWAFDTLAIWSILQSIGVALNWKQMLSTVGVISLSTLLPSAPGYVGTYQYAYAVMVRQFGYPAAQGVAGAIAAQILLMGSVTLIGLGLYLYCQFFSPPHPKTNLD